MRRGRRSGPHWLDKQSGYPRVHRWEWEWGGVTIDLYFHVLKAALSQYRNNRSSYDPCIICGLLFKCSMYYFRNASMCLRVLLYFMCWILLCIKD